MAKLPYFKFFVSDWLGSRKVLMMTDAQKGIYITLLAHQWSDPTCSIPTDRKILQKMLPGSKWSNIKYVIGECFDVEGTSEERARNARLTVEEAKAIGKAMKASYAGKCSANKRLQPTSVERPLNECSTIPDTRYHSQIPEEPKSVVVKTRKPKARFTPPTVEEVKAYCEERKNSIDPQNFVDSNTAKGWVIGKNKSPAKDWQAMIRTWEKTERDKNDGTSQRHTTAGQHESKPGKYSGVGEPPLRV
jgi:uncharacterized protein YdaU (DUF1376 family)